MQANWCGEICRVLCAYFPQFAKLLIGSYTELNAPQRTFLNSIHSRNWRTLLLFYINYLSLKCKTWPRRYKLTVIMNRTIIFSNFSPCACRHRCRCRCRCRRLWCQTWKFSVNFCFVWFWFCHKHLFRAAELPVQTRNDNPTEGAYTTNNLHIAYKTANAVLKYANFPCLYNKHTMIMDNFCWWCLLIQNYFPYPFYSSDAIHTNIHHVRRA